MQKGKKENIEMTKKKKIALLSLRYDNNYGGNLQRYALVKILQQLDFDVTCFYFRYNWSHKGLWYWVKRTLKQVIKRYILRKKNEKVCLWKDEKKEYAEKALLTMPFYKKYIPHTPVIYGDWWLRRRYMLLHHFDAFVVGSDQIWRKKYIEQYGLGTWFLDFVPDTFQGKRIIYGASFGTDEHDYTEEDLRIIRPLYKKFDAVSVRETIGLAMLKDYGLTQPQAIHVVDPVFLIDKNDWSTLANSNNTNPFDRDIFCYMLYLDNEKQEIIKTIAKNKRYNYYIADLNANTISIEQWLRNIRDAKYVITDSYHGLLFSLLFNKPYMLLQMGKNGGNSRFESIFNMFDISNIGADIDWDKINERIIVEREKARRFLQKSLLK